MPSPPKMVPSPEVALFTKVKPPTNPPLTSLKNVWTLFEALVIPDPLRMSGTPGSALMLNEFAPELKLSPLISVRADTATCVTLDMAKLAMSDGPFGTVCGIQFAAVFQSLFVGFLSQVALPANEGCCTARNSSAATSRQINGVDETFISCAA